MLPLQTHHCCNNTTRIIDKEKTNTKTEKGRGQPAKLLESETGSKVLRWIFSDLNVTKASLEDYLSSLYNLSIVFDLIRYLLYVYKFNLLSIFCTTFENASGFKPLKAAYFKYLPNIRAGGTDKGREKVTK